MKHLKSYKLFESSDIEQVIKYILLPISDGHFQYEISVEEYAAIPQLVIRVVSWTDEPLLITDEIKEEFISMKYYLESEGYNSILVKYWRPNSISYSKPFDYFINNTEGTLSNLLFVAKKSSQSPEDILKNISLDLSDEGLYIDFPNDNKFGGKFYLSVEDKDRIFCKNYPVDDLDWLLSKPIINELIDRLEGFGFKRDREYKLYGGGLGVNFVFDDKNVVEL